MALDRKIEALFMASTGERGGFRGSGELPRFLGEFSLKEFLVAGSARA
jgi:hypothetical protein